MTEPLSIAASIVGITVPALHGIRILLQDLQQLKDVPKTIKRLTEDVQSVSTSLELLQSIDEREWDLLGTSVLEESKTTISSCTQACNLFRSDLQHWTRHSEGRLAWQDRTSLGIFKQGQIKAMAEQLQNCKLSINSVVAIATLYTSVRHTHITESIRTSITTAQESIQNAATTTSNHLIVLESKLEELNQSEDDEDEEPSSQPFKASTLQQLQEEHKALSASQSLLGNLLKKAQEDAIAKAAFKVESGTTVGTVTFGTNNSGQQAGVINGGVHGAVFGRK